MVNQKNGFFSKLTGLTSIVFNLNLENIHDEVDENLSALERAVLYGNSQKKCRKIIFVKNLINSLNNIDCDNFKKVIYPLIVKLSNDKEEIKNELCNQMGDLCAYLLQNNSGLEGCSDIINLLFPIIEKFIRNGLGDNSESVGSSSESGEMLANAIKALLILATHIKMKYRKKVIFPFILSLISSDKFKNLGFILLIKISYIFERDIAFRYLLPCIESFVRNKDEESKIFVSSYFYSICKIANEEDLPTIFFIFKLLCNDSNDIIKIISMYNCVHISSLYSKNLFLHFFVPLFNSFLKNSNLYIFYYALINLFFFVCLFEDIDIIHPFYIHKMIFFFNNIFSSHLFTLNYLNDTAKRQSNYFLLNNPRMDASPRDSLHTIGQKQPVGEAHTIDNTNEMNLMPSCHFTNRQCMNTSVKEISEKPHEFPSMNNISMEGVVVIDINQSNQKCQNNQEEQSAHEGNRKLQEKADILNNQEVDVKKDFLSSKEEKASDDICKVLHEQSSQEKEKKNALTRFLVKDEKNGLTYNIDMSITDGCTDKHKMKLELQDEKTFELEDSVNIRRLAYQPTLKSVQVNECKNYKREGDYMKEECEENDARVNGIHKMEEVKNGGNDDTMLQCEHSSLQEQPSMLQDIGWLFSPSSSCVASSALLESSDGISLHSSIPTSQPTSSFISSGSISIFVNNSLINDLIISNNHFSLSVRQFFQVHDGESTTEGDEASGEETTKNEKLDEHRCNHQDRVQKEKNLIKGMNCKVNNDPMVEDKNGEEVMWYESLHKGHNKNYKFVQITENDITFIDNIYNHDNTININQIKGWHYSDVELIKGSMIYGEVFMKKGNKYKGSGIKITTNGCSNKNVDKFCQNGQNKEKSPINIHCNQKEDDIYNIEAVNIETIKKRFLFDTPNNIIVSHNINAVYITALHLPTLILVLKKYFFRFFSHVFFFICTYPYYVIRKTIASLFYAILRNFLGSPQFLKINLEELNEDRDLIMTKFKRNEKNKLEENKPNHLSTSHFVNIEKSKRVHRNDTHRTELFEVTQNSHIDSYDHCDMKRIQSKHMVRNHSKEKKDEINNGNIIDAVGKSSAGCDINKNNTFSSPNKLTKEEQMKGHYSDHDEEKQKECGSGVYELNEELDPHIDKTSNQRSDEQLEERLCQDEVKMDRAEIMKRMQNEINANLLENDFFINEENENFFFYKKFLQKYEIVYIRCIDKFKKYYREDSPLFFFHFFISYFLKDSNVLVKKAILKNYDKIILFFPSPVQRILISYLSDVLDFKTLNYSLRKRVSKIVFRLLSSTDNTPVVRKVLFPLFLRLCKDDVSSIRVYTASYFYLFLEKGCPQIYNFFKGGGEILPIEEYKKDSILINGENYKLRSRYFTSGDEISIIKTVLITFAKSCHFYSRQIFIKMCDGIINMCPMNLFLLYFLKPFVNLSIDKIKVVRTTWDKCVFSQLRKKGHFLNSINIWGKRNEIYAQNGAKTVDKEYFITLNPIDSDELNKSFDLHDLND
ncbi:hypothetical protein, conserved [Plasmodium gonderi]|uniref:Uncharacterized protein n=1 Tax=Plasmodium gonderi TaxID=77519 RepID=A0A1Y1JFD4_PLAGO|nr:hypothetical protein, conserved [Plasmodium gonderi]GAW80045.1 hypothetical protein, conserved [Plasmodium gonderi]